MEFKPTRRGQLRTDFRDRYGALCSIQESSIPGEECIWLGVDVNFEGAEVRHGRMHLTQEMARQLIPILRHFARKGTLGIDTAENPYYIGAWVVGVGEEVRGIEGRIVEVHPNECLIVQDYNRPGPDGQVICSWDRVDLIWEPTEVPEVIPTRYDRLIDDEPESEEP